MLAIANISLGAYKLENLKEILFELFGDNDPRIATFVWHNSNAMDKETSRVWAAPINLGGPFGYNHIENFSETRCRFAADCTVRRVRLN